MLLTKRDQMVEDINVWADKYGRDRSAMMPILQEVQKKYGRIFSFSMQTIANLLGIHPVEVYGVVSFYSFLHNETRGRFFIRLCRTITCEMAGKDSVARQLQNDLGIEFGQTTKDGMFTLEWGNCMGMCDQGPAMKVNDQIFTRVTPQDVHEIIERCRHALTAYATDGKQEKIAATMKTTLTNGLTFGTAKADAGLKAIIGQNSTDILKMIEASGLRGRGGAGFPASMKWKFAAQAKGPVKYVVCNADEGEPGTFKDRVILSDCPDLVFEGMTIAARAIGATKGIVYLRGEYTYLRGFLESVLETRRELGTLGQNILGSQGFNFDIEIRMGAGAYVCGEETALIESLEGQRGEPRNRPPFPVDTGFMGCPTVVNNVETLAYVSCIASRGANWFKNCGTDKSPGLKLFSVSGDCDKPGVYEFPLGITIAELLEQVGGQNAKAVQVGGASGQCIPADQFHRQIAFEDIATGGSVIVFGPHRDMLAVVKNFLEFFADESCGQCTPCREGNLKLLEGVEMLEKGQCSMAYLKELCALGETMQLASKCGLGQSSPNAFLSVVKNFQDEILGRTEPIFLS